MVLKQMIYTKIFCLTGHERKHQNIFAFFFFWYLVDILIANNEDYSYRGNLQLFDFTHEKDVYAVGVSCLLQVTSPAGWSTSHCQ